MTSTSTSTYPPHLSPVLRAMLETRRTKDADGVLRTIDDASISGRHALALNRTVSAENPRVVVEIGMAHGVSSLAILSALHAGEGRLISIDPNQHMQWHATGVSNVVRAGFSQAHELLEIPDYLGLPRLLEQNTIVDFAYVDGWHTFDYTMLDFFYLDKLLKVGGVVGFNDCGWPAVDKVLRFVRTHRHYKELDVGLRPDYGPRTYNPLRIARRRMRDRSAADRYFRKVEDWEPTWHFYANF